MSHFYFPKCVWVLPTCQAMLPQISNWCPVIDLGSTTIYPATMWDPFLPKITAPFSQDCPNISPEDVSWKYKSGDPYSWRSYKSNSQNHLLDFYPTRYTHRIQGNNSPTTVTVDRHKSERHHTSEKRSSVRVLHLGQGVGEGHRTSKSSLVHFYMLRNSEILQALSFRGFLVPSSCRHGWLRHWSLVSVSTFSYSASHELGGKLNTSTLDNMIVSPGNQPHSWGFLGAHEKWTQKDKRPSCHPGSLTGLRRSASEAEIKG